MTAWTQPGEHLRKADEYIAKADEMATKSGINIETMSRLGVLTRLAQVHVDIAMAKRPT